MPLKWTFAGCIAVVHIELMNDIRTQENDLKTLEHKMRIKENTTFDSALDGVWIPVDNSDQDKETETQIFIKLLLMCRM